MNTFKKSVLVTALLSAPMLASAATNTDKLKEEINTLKQQNKTIMERLDASMDMMENQKSGHGSKGSTTIGGYGELHYNNLSGEGGASDKKEIDFHRFVLFFGHEFSKDIRFFSELEVEHSLAGEGKPGEVELEQAYIEFDINKTMQAKGGLFLIPVGIINETHEPNTFYGTERNPVEKNIIPATWWEAGASLSGKFNKGLSYDVALTSGLDLNANNKIRDGRQKVAKARADSPMITGRLKYTGTAGLELATTVATISDYTQGQGTKNSATMVEAHAVYNTGNFGLRALYASWDVDGKTTGYDEQSGWYIEPSYKINPKFGVFARYNKYDNQAGTGGPGNSEKTQTDIGVNYWPHEDVVIKVDYQTQDNANNQDQNGINIGIGYQF
jgi:predicted porin